MEILLALVAWFAFCKALEELGPPLIEGLVCVFRFLLLALAVALRSVVRGCAYSLAAGFRLAVCGVRITGSALASALTFLRYFLQELRRGPEPDPEPDEDDLYEAALVLLGLDENYTRAALDAAYRRAMKTAHPDLGGNVDDAQALNTAREILMRRAPSS